MWLNPGLELARNPHIKRRRRSRFRKINLRIRVCSRRAKLHVLWFDLKKITTAVCGGFRLRSWTALVTSGAKVVSQTVHCLSSYTYASSNPRAEQNLKPSSTVVARRQVAGPSYNPGRSGPQSDDFCSYSCSARAGLDQARG